jgi:hypothetical protein
MLTPVLIVLISGYGSRLVGVGGLSGSTPGYTLLQVYRLLAFT